MAEHEQELAQPSGHYRERERFFHLRPLFVFSVVMFSCGALFFSYRMLAPVLAHYADRETISVTRVDLTEPNEPSQPPGNSNTPSVLRLAVAPMISAERNASMYADLITYLAAKTGRQPVLLQRSSYGDINDLVRFGWCELALVGAYAYVRGDQEFGMRLLATPESKAQKGHRCCVVVPQSSPAASLLDLKGKRFAFVDFMSNAGWIYPAMWLRDHAQNPWLFFGEQFITRGHDNSLEAVMKGYLDSSFKCNPVFSPLILKDFPWRSIFESFSWPVI